MGLGPLHFILDPVDEDSILDEDSLRMKFLSSIGDTRPGSSKLDFWDRRLKETRALGYQKSTIQIPDDIPYATLGTPNAVIEVNLDKSQERGLQRKDKNPSCSYRGSKRIPGIRSIKGWTSSAKMVILYSQADISLKYLVHKYNLDLKNWTAPEKSDLINDICHPITYLSQALLYHI